MDHNSTMSSDTMPNIFPDRPIRPLPKRRLRERLSPQVAESIKYPPSTLNSVPLFQYPCSSKEEETHSNIEFTGSSGGLQQVESAKSLPGRRNEGVIGTYGAEIGRRTIVTRSPPEILNRTVSGSSRPEQSRSRMQPAPSTPSSVDGYDSFENTNNKKKRKIPSAGDSALNSAHGLNIDMSSHPASAGTGSPPGEVNGDHSLYSSAGYTTTGSFGSNGQGMSGSGRGRLGRSRVGRSPLRALSDGSNLSGPRASKGASQWSSEHEGSSGIIRNAIANAEKLPPQGQENVSLLQQHSVRSKGTPSSSQFTFTCDSQVTGTLHWPANSSRQSMGPQSGAGFVNGAPVALHEDLNKAANRDSRRKTRRQVEKELVRAAEDRRQSTAKRHYQNPPKPEDFWICEFCEYEAIFGEPPRALIREYELKDRRFRQEEADRKRLLEKAKQKGRKGKKNGKPSSKGSSTANQPDSAGTYETNVPPRNQSGNSQSTQSEDDEDEQTAELEETYRTPQPSGTLGIEEDSGGGLRRRRGVSVDGGGAGIPRTPITEVEVP